MNNILIKEGISSMIYEVEGNYVILDSDLAKLYGVETKRINEVIRRNNDLFNESVYFKLSDEEYSDLRFQIGTSKDSLRSQNATSKTKDNRGGRRYLPYVFTRDGVSILGSIMRGDNAKNITLDILKEFDKLETRNNLIIKGKT